VNFKFEEICELIRLVGTTGVGGVDIEHAGGRLRIKGAPATAATTTVPVAPAEVVTTMAAATAAAAADGASEPGQEKLAEDLHVVTSPIVGTFYRAPGPESDPFVKVGDFVEKGQVLCIVEAMKLFNEIESDMTGTVVQVLVENSEPVEFGEQLFAIRPT
jgi:acetyl-CoA carboxylase biotin carboxyl carrier protein